MLQLQRASAGSGKTYTLAGKYITLLLTEPLHKEEPGNRADGKPSLRLRTDEEIADAVGRTLAITFTNKATNEMKERIVSKLAALGRHTATSKPADYAKDIMAATGATDEEVAAKARTALSILLHSYSDFQVSTIDSFFQVILRTFAYEADLNDAYEVEIDSDSVGKAGIDATLAEVNDKEKNQTTYWIKKLMRIYADKGSKWNIFQGRDEPEANPFTNSQTIYGSLKNAVGRLQNEDYKKIRKKMDEYFDAHPDWAEILEQLEERETGGMVQAHKELIAKAKKCDKMLHDEFPHYFCDSISTRTNAGRMLAYPARILATCINPLKCKKGDAYLVTPINCEGLRKGATKHLNGDTDRVIEIVSPLADLLDAWYRAGDSDAITRWNIYGPNLPYLALMNLVRHNTAAFLRDNNLVELGETNSLLERIIGDDDTPFIYERTGIMTDHYLIDEFQDTSAMQWANLRPLLRESESHDNENLIIGDAKQSIYRFRNADSSLITHVVPSEFPRHELRGTTREQNTNYRSAVDIVEFNNTLFSRLPHWVLGFYTGDERAKLKKEFDILYSNVVQCPAKSDLPGYVSIEFEPNNDSEVPADENVEGLDAGTGSAAGEEDILKDLPSRRVIEIILDVMSRGYKQRDIAVLVRTNGKGKEIIHDLTEYNSHRPVDAPAIDFVSEESLLISESLSVKLIVSALEMISRGAMLNVRSGEEAEKKGVADLAEIAGGFAFYSMNHPEIAAEERIDSYLNDHTSFAWINEMLSHMHSVALPALVEAIADHISAEQRNADAPYISAFQDIVLDYCEKYPSDTASFLNWWEKNKRSKSISSPEDTDAVNIMTIHKSKGLEFPCVILPEINRNFSEDKNYSESDWRWVEPSPEFGVGLDLPPYLPVKMNKDLKGTDHEDVLNDYVTANRKDSLNLIYVATTRAVRELYILHPSITQANENPEKAKGPTDNTGTFFNLLEEFANEKIETKEEFQLGPDALKPRSKENRVVVGGPTYPLTDSQEDADAKKGADKDGKAGEKGADNREKTDEKRVVTISSYPINASLPLLAYHEEKPTRKIYDEEDPDPRSEGNLLHDIMASVGTPRDIDRSVRAMRMRGMINRQQEREFISLLTDAVADPRVAQWFAPGLRVINERSILGSTTSYRPDRVVVTPEGDATVIDYKFGELAKPEYISQVRNYMILLRNTAAGLFRSVKGYIWYVRRNEIVEI